MVVREDVGWSHRAAGGQHLVGALDRFGADARRTGFRGFVSGAGGGCSSYVSMTCWLRVSTASRCHLWVDMLLFRSWSWSLLLLCLSVQITWALWFLLAPNLLWRNHLSRYCPLILWHNVARLARPHLLCTATSRSNISLILVVIIWLAHMTMATRCRSCLLHWLSVTILVDQVVIAWRVSSSSQLLLVLLLLFLAGVYYWVDLRCGLDWLLGLLGSGGAWTLLFLGRSLGHANVGGEDAVV